MKMGAFFLPSILVMFAVVEGFNIEQACPQVLNSFLESMIKSLIKQWFWASAASRLASLLQLMKTTNNVTIDENNN